MPTKEVLLSKPRPNSRSPLLGRLRKTYGQRQSSKRVEGRRRSHPLYPTRRIVGIGVGRYCVASAAACPLSSSRSRCMQACAYNHFPEVIRRFQIQRGRARNSLARHPPPLLHLNSLYARAQILRSRAEIKRPQEKKEIWQWTRNRDRLEDHSFPPWPAYPTDSRTP